MVYIASQLVEEMKNWDWLNRETEQDKEKVGLHKSQEGGWRPGAMEITGRSGQQLCP